MKITKPTFVIVGLFFFSIAVPNGASADWVAIDDLPKSDQLLLRSVGLVAQPSTLESAHSHGQIGGTIGLGLRRPAQSLVGSTEEDSNPELSHDALQIHVVKGLNAPIDLGFSFSRIQDSPGNAMAAYLQWTMFEAFQLPSLAVRVGASQTFGYDFVALSSVSGQLLIGYDFFQFLGIYAGIGGTANRATIDLSGENEGFALARSSDTIVNTIGATTDWQDRHAMFGVSVKPYPPFLSIGAEVVRTDSGVESGSVKIALGM